MEDKILSRIRELEEEKKKVATLLINRFQSQLELELRPFDVAIAELKNLLGNEQNESV